MRAGSVDFIRARPGRPKSRGRERWFDTHMSNGSSGRSSGSGFFRITFPAPTSRGQWQFDPQVRHPLQRRVRVGIGATLRHRLPVRCKPFRGPQRAKLPPEEGGESIELNWKSNRPPGTRFSGAGEPGAPSAISRISIGKLRSCGRSRRCAISSPGMTVSCRIASIRITDVPLPIDPVTDEPFSYRSDGRTATLEASAQEGRPRSGWRFEIAVAK